MSWELIDSYLRNKNVAQLEIDSFNQFVEQKLNDIVAENALIVPKIEEVRIELSNIEVEKPRIMEADGSPHEEFTPMEARLRNRSYAGPLLFNNVDYLEEMLNKMREEHLLGIYQ